MRLRRTPGLQPHPPPTPPPPHPHPRSQNVLCVNYNPQKWLQGTCNTSSRSPGNSCHLLLPVAGIYLASPDAMSPPASIVPNVACSPERGCLDKLTCLGRGALTQDERGGLFEVPGRSYRDVLQGACFPFQRTSRYIFPDTMGAESFHPASSALSSLLLISFQERGHLCLLSMCMVCLHSQDEQLCGMARRPR